MFRVSCFPSTFLHSHRKGKSVSEFKCKEKCFKGSESGAGVYEIHLLFQYECKLLLQRPYWMPSCHPRGQLYLTSDHQSILKHHMNFLNTGPKTKMLTPCIFLSEHLHCAFFWGELSSWSLACTDSISWKRYAKVVFRVLCQSSKVVSKVSVSYQR